MKRLVALAAALLVTGAPALAKDFVQDQAGMFSQATIDQLNTRIGNFNAQTHKEIIVQTVPSVSDGDVRTAAQNAYTQQQVNGVLIFVDKGDRKDYVLPDNAAVQAGWWSSETSTSIAQAMEAQFRTGDYDGGITTAVNLALNVYRSHLSSLGGAQNGYPAAQSANAQPAAANGVHLSMFWIIVMLFVAFLVIRSLMRAASAPRYYGGAPGPGSPPAGAPGPGYYGPGYGGGGGFFSGLLGGLGGAWLGNELFGGRNMGGGGSFGNVVDPGAGPADAGGWQSDPGQAGIGGGGGGDWGGGGFGGGDFGGGGGGGDFGGGGGGGW